MRFLVLLLAVSCISAAPNSRALWDFHALIKCAIPNSAPLKEFNNYGCYCGLGGSGTPKDTLDRCCQTHDNCYSNAKNQGCSGIFDNVYTNGYKYSCSGTTITCSSTNNSCEQFICNCDKAAAVCFSKAPYNPAYKDLDKSKNC
ncbi:phospholipase A2 [Pelobates cultripes]|uniref:Phospholipase A2 n=1 Tax=Pelobates cultripes TaxID=61616 RepID=A0AAD1SAA8_PELCU|nr:phospholipase A2 [Pelobates cultripes]